jgi:hypothetical protein
VAKSNPANCEPLSDLLGYVDDVLKRLKIYPEVSVIPGVTQTVIKIMTEFVLVFAIATKDIEGGYSLSELVLIRKSCFNVALREMWKCTTQGD